MKIIELLNEFSKETNAVNTVSSTAWSNSENSDLIDLILNSVNNNSDLWYIALTKANSISKDFLTNWSTANNYVTNIASERRLEDTVRKINHVAFGGENIRINEKLALGAITALLVYDSKYPRLEFPKTSREAMNLSKNIFIDKIMKKDYLCTLLYPAKLVYDHIIDTNRNHDTVTNRDSDRNDVTTSRTKNLQKENIMKKSIFSVLNEMYEAKNVVKKPTSDLPSAKSLNDVDKDIDDDVVDNDKVDDKDLSTAVENFKKHGSTFGPDLYSFSSIDYSDEWNARNASSLAYNLSNVDLDNINSVINSMSNASGRDGNMTFIILNGRSGEVVAAGFGGDSISDGIVMDTLDSDQQKIVKSINSMNVKYINAGGGSDEETSRNFQIREHILSLLKYDKQPVKTDKPRSNWGIKSREEMTPDELRRSDEARRLALADSQARRAARQAKQAAEKNNKPAREKR